MSGAVLTTKRWIKYPLVKNKGAHVIGSNRLRSDAQSKMDGSLHYTADRKYEGMLHGLVIRAPLSHGYLRAIRQKSGVVDWSKIIFATAKDIPAKKTVQMIADDMPFLAEEEVLFKGEPVALVAAPTLAEAEAARQAIEVEMDPLPAILTLAELIQLHQARAKDLVELARWSIEKEEVSQALAEAEIILEDCYTTPHQEQAYLETNAVTAVPEPNGGMRLEGSLQCPFYVAPAVAAMLGMDLNQFHVHALPMGGAFGGKEDFPSQLGGQAALLAHLSGRPVRMVLSRAEDIAYTTKRHPSWMRVKAGAKRDGSLCGLEMEIIFDGGAYITMSPVVLSRGAIHAAGPYFWPAAHIQAIAYRTHTPPNGAFRGFGVPQTIFAIESHMDRLARACGLEPQAFRLKNRLKVGDTTATSQRLNESVATFEVLEESVKASDFENKWRSWGTAQREGACLSDNHHAGHISNRENPLPTSPFSINSINKISEPTSAIARGIGLALFWHGGGFTGSGEVKIAARASLDLSADGKAHVRVSSTEMGQGAHTVLPQIAAEELGIATDDVSCDPVDTKTVPNSGPTVASRTTMIVGGVIAACARAAREHLLHKISERHRIPRPELFLNEGIVRHQKSVLGSFPHLLKDLLAEEPRDAWTFTEQYQIPPQLSWDEKRHYGDAYAAYSWGCTVAEVEIDCNTYEIKVPRITTAMDIGRAINPLLAQGQMEGGTLQALGFTLTEEVGLKTDGTFLRDRFQTYILPTALDAPEMEVRIIEAPYSRGPGGAKGLGELPMHGTAPAIANAVEHALGVRIKDLPVTPEKILAAINASRNPCKEE